MIRIELGQPVKGSLPKIGTYCAALINGYWDFGTWHYRDGKIVLDLVGEFVLLEQVTAWIELPKNIGEVKNAG